MAGRRLIDTNIAVAMLNDDERIWRRSLSTSIYIPSIVLGELYHGVFQSTKSAENEAKLGELKKISIILDCDEETAWHYGQTKTQLHAKGRMIPDNDIWIAGISQQYSLTLVSRDQHFAEVAPLDWEQW